MGLFDWFSKPLSRVTQEPDSIWLTKAAKFHGIARVVTQAAAGSDCPLLLVAHFDDTLELLQRIVERCAENLDVAVVRTDQLSTIAGRVPTSESASLAIIVGERHPQAARDQQFLHELERLTCRSRLAHHLSLQDPMVRAFAGDWVQQTLRRLGMKEDESIQSPMVSKRILAAQKKLAKQSADAEALESAEAWMERNCPDLWNRVRSEA